jgi:hypothetical protein
LELMYACEVMSSQKTISWRGQLLNYWSV